MFVSYFEENIYAVYSREVVNQTATRSNMSETAGKYLYEHMKSMCGVYFQAPDSSFHTRILSQASPLLHLESFSDLSVADYTHECSQRNFTRQVQGGIATMALDRRTPLNYRLKPICPFEENEDRRYHHHVSEDRDVPTLGTGIKPRRGGRIP